jgi:hypothetical protein
MNTHIERGGDGGADVETNEAPLTPPSPPSAPTVPLVPDFIVREREQALQTLREITPQEIASLSSYPARKTIIGVRHGWIPQREIEWNAVLAAASFVDHPWTAQGKNARSGRRVLIAEIKDTVRKMASPPVVIQQVPVVDLSRFDDDEYLAGGELVPESVSPILAMVRERERSINRGHVLDEEIDPDEIYGPPLPDPALVARHAEHCASHPWITFYLGYRPSPISEPLVIEDPVKVIRAPRDRLTLMSCRKARERHRERGIPMEPDWVASLDVMYRDVIAAIGVCPADVDEYRQRIFTLDRYPKPKRGYTRGNLRWADKSQQRDNQARNRRRTIPPGLIGVEPSSPAAEPTDESLMP